MLQLIRVEKDHPSTLRLRGAAGATIDPWWRSLVPRQAMLGARLDVGSAADGGQSLHTAGPCD